MTKDGRTKFLFFLLKQNLSIFFSKLFYIKDRLNNFKKNNTILSALKNKTFVRQN